MLDALTEKQVARISRRLGHNVVRIRGRYWRWRELGFLEPVHLAATFAEDEVAPLRKVTLGYRARMANPGLAAPAALLPYVLSDVQSYGLHRLKSRRRTQVRKCYQSLEIRQLTDSALLEEQGYAVVLAGLARTLHLRPPRQAAFLRDTRVWTSAPGLVTLAALREGRLVGILTGYAAEKTAYHVNTFINEKGLKHSAGIGMLFHFLEMCSRTPGLEQAVSGLFQHDNPGLYHSKSQLGFEVAQWPAHSWLSPLVRPVLRRHLPVKYGRWLGEFRPEDVAFESG